MTKGEFKKSLQSELHYEPGFTSVKITGVYDVGVNTVILFGDDITPEFAKWLNKRFGGVLTPSANRKAVIICTPVQRYALANDNYAAQLGDAILAQGAGILPK